MVNAERPERLNEPNDPNGPNAIAARLAAIRDRIAMAAGSAGRDPSSVRLVAVSKTFPLESVRDAYHAGQRDFGENRVQEALQKIERSTDLLIRWHLIGHLQTNKARKAGPAFAVIQSVDTVELVRKLDGAAEEAGRAPELLIQVDLAGEAAKHGAPPDEVPRLFEAAAACRAARVVGLMTLPPVPDTPEDARPWFRRLRDLRDQWQAAGVPASMLRELSMGMSGDFEVAIQEGATLVRIGTAIFGSRHVEE
jgi:pyridoxal phosphate enzyme (YggS family)